MNNYSNGSYLSDEYAPVLGTPAAGTSRFGVRVTEKKPRLIIVYDDSVDSMDMARKVEAIMVSLLGGTSTEGNILVAAVKMDSLFEFDVSCVTLTQFKKKICAEEGRHFVEKFDDIFTATRPVSVLLLGKSDNKSMERQNPVKQMISMRTLVNEHFKTLLGNESYQPKHVRFGILLVDKTMSERDPFLVTKRNFIAQGLNKDFASPCGIYGFVFYPDFFYFAEMKLTLAKCISHFFREQESLSLGLKKSGEDHLGSKVNYMGIFDGCRGIMVASHQFKRDPSIHKDEADIAPIWLIELFFRLNLAIKPAMNYLATTPGYEVGSLDSVNRHRVEQIAGAPMQYSVDLVDADGATHFTATRLNDRLSLVVCHTKELRYSDQIMLVLTEYFTDLVAQLKRPEYYEEKEKEFAEKMAKLTF